MHIAQATSALLIRIAKHANGSAVLSITRPDGSVVWQRQTPERAAFFVRHDLTHYAVETILRHRHGFYGIIADGWSFDDFATPRPRERFPANADPSELFVGLLDAERTGTPCSAADFNEHAATFNAKFGAPPPHTVTDDQLNQIRARLNDLIRQWEEVAPGEALELLFHLNLTGSAQR